MIFMCLSSRTELSSKMALDDVNRRPCKLKNSLFLFTAIAQRSMYPKIAKAFAKFVEKSEKVAYIRLNPIKGWFYAKKP